MRSFRLGTTAVIAAVALTCAGATAIAAHGAPSMERDTTGASVWVRVERRCAALSAEPLPPYPWPIAPVRRQHPVRGYFGDPRTVVTGIDEGAFSFHNGVDISARTGARVLPVTSGVVAKLTPDRVIVASAYDRRFQYIHIHPLVRLGERVVASKTVLGLVDPVFHHVHLSEIRGDCVVNPLAPGHLTPFRDTTRPVVRSIVFENAAGERLSPLAINGKVRVIANAFDRPAIPSPPPWGSMPVTPAEVKWKLTTVTGRVLRSHIAADFRISLPPNREFCEIYAPGTLQNFAAELGKFHWGKPGVYLYDLTPHFLDTATLHPGRYRFVVAASNIAGITGTRSVTIVVHHRPLAAEPPPRPDTRCEPR